MNLGEILGYDFDKFPKLTLFSMTSLASSEDKLKDFSSFNDFSSISSGILIFDRKDFVIFISLTSVSGYILASPGNGLKKEVLRLLSAFLTSPFFGFSLIKREISYSITFGIDLKSWKPFISILGEFFIDKLTSWRIVPIPLFTFAALRMFPMISAVSLACSGSFISEEVDISIRGTPNLSNL